MTGECPTHGCHCNPDPNNPCKDDPPVIRPRHPVTGHDYQHAQDVQVLPSQLTVEVVRSQYPGEEHIYMAEMVGVIMLPDGRAQLWTQVADGTTIAKALAAAAALAQTEWDECMHGDDPGVPHCYCTNEHTPAQEDNIGEPVIACCRCAASAPLAYFGLDNSPAPVGLPEDIKALVAEVLAIGNPGPMDGESK